MMLWLIAQEVVKTDQTGPLPILQTGGQWGTLALIAWIAYKAFPKIAQFLRDDRKAMLDTFAIEQEKSRQTFAAEQEMSRQTFKEEMTASRDDRKQLIQAFKLEVDLVRSDARTDRTAAEARTDRITQEFSKSVDSLRDDIKDNTTATRDLVLELRDNTGTIKKANGKDKHQ